MLEGNLSRLPQRLYAGDERVFGDSIRSEEWTRSSGFQTRNAHEAGLRVARIYAVQQRRRICATLAMAQGTSG